MKQILQKFSQISVFLFLFALTTFSSVNAQTVVTINSGTSDVKVCSGNFSVNVYFENLVDGGLYELYWNSLLIGTFNEALSMTNLTANAVRDQTDITTAGISQFGAKLIEIYGVPQPGQPIVSSGPTFAFGAGVLPTAGAITGASSVCLVKQTTLTANASGGSGTYTSYSWNSDNGNAGVSGTNNTTEAIGSFIGSSDITYTVTDNHGCTSNPSAAFNITVNSLPSAPLAGNVTATYDGAVKTGTATPGTNETIDWYTASTNGTPTTAPSRTTVGTTTAYAEARNTITGCVSSSRTQVDVTITPKGLTITGLTGDNKVYNGTTAATASGTAEYSGLENGETFAVSGTPVYTFASAGVANGITINTSGFTAPSANYTLTQPTLSGNITAKGLTITGLTGDNKVYNGT
ncbi:MAG: YDG domain-containing protein, partial [Bacteroidia bacterium]|nr:YDG domain-containing protein [Bacteroidia bacterium]